MLWTDRSERAATRTAVSSGRPKATISRPAQRLVHERPPAEGRRATIGAALATTSAAAATSAGGWLVIRSACHKIRPVLGLKLLPCLGAAGLGGIGRPEPERDAGDHDTRLEQQPCLEPQSALVVKHVLPPVAHDILGDEHGHDIAGTFTAQSGDVLDHWTGDVAERGVQHRQRNRNVTLLPLAHQLI